MASQLEILIENINLLEQSGGNPQDVRDMVSDFGYTPQRFERALEMLEKSGGKVTPSSTASNLITEEISAKYKKKHIFTLFPRKRNIRRTDKNWGEEKWEQFIKLLVAKYDPLIVICGTKDGSYFTNLKNDKNIFNSINFKKKISLLDLQISFIKKSNISIHGLSGSAILSLLCKKKTFMYGNNKEYRTICIEGNPLKTKLMYYNDETLSPNPLKLFEKFMEFYEK